MHHPEQSNSSWWLVQSHVLDVIRVVESEEWTRNHMVIIGYLSVTMAHEGITHEGKVQFSCFTETLTLWFNEAEVYSFMSSSWSHAIASAVCRKTTEICFTTQTIWIAPNKWLLKKATARTPFSRSQQHTQTPMRGHWSQLTCQERPTLRDETETQRADRDVKDGRAKT